MKSIKIIDEQTKTEGIPGNLTRSKQKYDYMVKYVVIGDEGVGKSSLIMKYTDNIYPADKINIDLKIKFTSIDKVILKEQLWEVPHQNLSKLKQNTRATRIHGIILTFDLTNEASLDYLDNYMKTINSDWEHTESPIPILVATKSDEQSERKISQELIDKFLEKYQIPVYVETSAKTGKNINAVFQNASKLFYDRYIKPYKNPQDPDKIKLITALEKYIHRIEEHKLSLTNPSPNFGYGFWFLKHDRAINRQANYLLAKELLADLKIPAKTILEVFSEIDTKRERIQSEKGLFSQYHLFWNGIHSTELNAIINEALNFSSPKIK